MAPSRPRAIGVVSYFVAVRPILKADRFSFGWMVSTLGFGLALENAIAYVVGPRSRAFPPLLNNIGVHIGGVLLTAQQILAIVVAAVIVARPRACAATDAFWQSRDGHGLRPRNGGMHRREYDDRRSRHIRDLWAFSGNSRRSDRPAHLRQPLPGRHVQHLRFCFDDDRRNRESRVRDGRRRPAWRSRRGRQHLYQFPGIGLVSVCHPSVGSAREPEGDIQPEGRPARAASASHQADPSLSPADTRAGREH